MSLSNFLKRFSTAERLLWALSVTAILTSAALFGRGDLLSPAASLIGVSSLLPNAKGHPLGQLLMIAFSLMYGLISLSFSYYGELLTYVGMTLPMAVFSLVAWLRHPFMGNRSQVEIARLTKSDIFRMLFLSAAVTVLFFFVLRALGTERLLPSTVSVTTSFLAAYLTYKRSPLYALAYAANDLVLILLWTLASLESTEYVSVAVCFAVFFINDIYGFICWKRAELLQRSAKKDALHSCHDDSDVL